MMTIKLPKACLDEIQQLQRNFVWGDTDDNKKIHPIAWDIVTTPKNQGGVGLRKLGLLNDVCLMKMGWKVYNNTDDLWCRVLRRKYNIIESNDCVKVRSNDSSLWKDIAKTIPDMLLKGRWVVGDGRTIHAWQDNWLGEEFRLSIDDGCIPENLRGAKVCDLINERGEWNLDMLTMWLPQQWIDKLRSTVPPSMEHIADCFCFAGTTPDVCAVKIMYEQMDKGEGDEEDKDWEKVWKAAVPERCKTFLWILKHDRLLTNFRKSRRGLGSAGCDLCGSVCETTLHALRDCTRCRHIWESIVPHEIRVEFFTSDASDWIHMNLNYRNRRSKGWSELWIMTCHTIWYWRNMEMHNVTYERPENPIGQILQRKQQYESALRISRKCHGESGCSMLVGWKRPTAHMCKLNTDGASKKDQEAGCGGIVRDSNGTWIGSFSKYLGRCSAIVAEFWGVLEGLKYTIALGISRVEVNVDAVAVVQAIEDGVTGLVDCVAILKQIKEIQKLYELVVISYAPRTTNMCADALANRGCLDKFDTVHTTAPDYLWPLLDADSLGISSFFVDPV